MKRRKIEMLEDVMGAIGDSRWDLVVNDFHKGDDDFDYAISHAGTGISMNRINLGDWDYFGMYLGDYETPEMQEGLEDYDDVYSKADDKVKVQMLLALNQALIDELEAQGQYEEEEGDEDE